MKYDRSICSADIYVLVGLRAPSPRSPRSKNIQRGDVEGGGWEGGRERPIQRRREIFPPLGISSSPTCPCGITKSDDLTTAPDKKIDPYTRIYKQCYFYFVPGFFSRRACNEGRLQNS